MKALKILNQFSSFKALNQQLEQYTTNQQTKLAGDIFELTVKLYLQTNPKYRTKLKNVWLGKQVPPKVKRLINYSVLPIKDLDLKFIEDLKSSLPDIVFIYSQNSAKNFLYLIKKYQLVDYLMDTNLMCIGEKTSSVLNEIKWKKIFLFNPGEEEFLLYKI